LQNKKLQRCFAKKNLQKSVRQHPVTLRDLNKKLQRCNFLMFQEFFDVSGVLQFFDVSGPKKSSTRFSLTAAVSVGKSF
jgi:hypothetical protein